MGRLIAGPVGMLFFLTAVYPERDGNPRRIDFQNQSYNHMNQQKNWYLVYTFPNSEKKICKELSKREITTFLPTKKVERQWSDRKKELEVPLFPNYVFVNIPSRQMWNVLMVDGVVKFIAFDGSPAVVKETEIDVIKKLATQAKNINKENCGLVTGEKVKIKHGPLSGLVGKVVKTNGTARLYVELETVQQVMSIDIESVMLDKVE